MLNRLRTRLDASRQDGFTLIELLIVIIILGVLAGIVVFAVGGVNDKSVQAACKSDLKSVEVAVEAYRASKGKYPDATGGAGATAAAASDARYDQLTETGKAFLKSKPTSDKYSVAITDVNGTVAATPANCAGL